MRIAAFPLGVIKRTDHMGEPVVDAKIHIVLHLYDV
jgi:hypothetical protein